ncbi:hypothetical protein O3G_MSEX009393 [Manduca sexta]|uniref:Uncharacterized protein n=1 Tax=Manduca sexta TaxID=7130 RepID=A0A921ZDS0_MANSE|nr:hypothetical protein O3G_MSEX009393 [Manduca sexta]
MSPKLGTNQRSGLRFFNLEKDTKHRAATEQQDSALIGANDTNETYMPVSVSEDASERDRRRGWQVENGTSVTVATILFSESGFSRPPPPPRRAAPPPRRRHHRLLRRSASCRAEPPVVLIICKAANEKDMSISTSRLSVDFHRRFEANVSHGVDTKLHYHYTH